MLTFELQAHREAKLSSRPSASLAMPLRGVPALPGRRFGREDSFEHKLEVIGLPPSPRRRFAMPRFGGDNLHGEFDPGSGRTLAARLTHASRARTQASAWGKAANG